MSEAHKPEVEQGPAPLHGLLAEYNTPGEILAASRKIRDAGFTRWDTFTPFPVHGIDKAMGIKMTILPWIVLGAALSGLATAILLQWWTNAYDYKWLISGKPFWSIPANVPIMFELTVLFAGITTLIAMLVLNDLPLPSHPLDLVRRFARSTNDKFFLLIEASDPKFDEGDTKELLEKTHAVAIESVPEDRVTSDALPKVLIYGVVVMTALAAVPFALAAKARYTRSPSPRIHAIQDMDSQPKYRAQRKNTTFADERSARGDLPGTVAVGELQDDDHFFRGKIGDAWATTFPSQVEFSDASMSRGKERFGVYCTPCHGLGGEGNGMVAKHAEALGEGTWVQPSNVTQEYLRVMPVGQLFDTITHGIRNMPGYGGQIPVADRWDIIMYLRALQRTQSGKVTDVPESERRSIK